MKPNIRQQYKDPQLAEKAEIHTNTPLFRVRSNIHSGACHECYDSWCAAEGCGGYYNPGKCYCCDDGSHQCDLYIVH